MIRNMLNKIYTKKEEKEEKSKTETREVKAKTKFTLACCQRGMQHVIP